MNVEHSDALISIRALVDIARKGLVSLYDKQEIAFYDRLIRQGTSVQVSGERTAASLPALLGLYEAYHYDVPVSFDLEGILAQYVANLSEVSSLADLGLSLWVIARSHPEMLERVYEQALLSTAFDRFTDAGAGNTKALSWFLTGLSEIRLSDGEEPDQLEELAFMTRQMLFMNYGGFGVFGNVQKASLLNQARTKYGSFEDQIFAMYAFARFGRAFHDEASLEVARECASRLIENQGELGQWCHSYEVGTGNVARKYPVRSVQQYGLAPLALYEVGELTGLMVFDAIEYGIAWVRGDNELSMDLLDQERHVIWEGVFDTKYNTYAKEWSISKGLRPQKDKKRALELSWECRSGDLGWLLFALAGHLAD